MNNSSNNTLVSADKLDEDKQFSVRPKKMDDFIGQKDTKDNLKIFINAALKRKESLDHILLYGPPGLGKTTLAGIIAEELGVNFKSTSGPLLNKPGDLAAILTNLEKHDVLFIDEIHRLSSNIEEILYPALEDYYLDLIIGEGPAARTVKIDLPYFTLVGATTRLGLISNPLRDRFGIPIRFEFYQQEELALLLKRAAYITNIKISANGAREIARRSRGTPRIALRLLRRIRDFAEIKNIDEIDEHLAHDTLTKLEIDKMGLDKADHSYMRFIMNHYHDNPVGIDTIAAALSENKNTIEEITEPYLIQLGFIQKTSRGRILTAQALKYLQPHHITNS